MTSVALKRVTWSTQGTSHEVGRPQPAVSSADVQPFSSMKGLILAQNERWRRVLGMQVEREIRFGGE